MKISKVLALVAVVLAVTSVAYAGPLGTPHNFDTLTANDPATGAALFYPAGSAPGVYNEGNTSVVVTNGANSGGVYSTSPFYGWTTPAPAAQTCDSTGQDPTSNDGFYCSQPLTYSTGAISGNFAIVVGPFSDSDADPGIGDTLNSYTTGASSYFFTDDFSSDGPGTYTRFAEVNVNLPAVAANAGPGGFNDLPVIAGIWRLGFGVDAINGAVITIANSVIVDAAGNYVITGNVDCTGGEGGCGGQVLFVDSEFDPSSSVPEPTTMLLLGSGLMFVARRFKR